MRLWFASSSEVPVYRQLVTQVVLAILSGELRPGDRLPSTRELARRFGLHPNTISAGYRQLEREGWTEARHGSGVYVRKQKDPAPTPEQILDQRIARFFRDLRSLQIPRAALRRRLEEWLASPPPDRLVLIDPDPELRPSCWPSCMLLSRFLSQRPTLTTARTRKPSPPPSFSADPAKPPPCAPPCRPARS